MSNTLLVRNNALVLIGAQALGGASPAIIISLGGLVGQALASNPTLATLPVSLYSLGLALGTVPAALLMRRHGRRAGYLLGALLGMAGGLVAAYGIWTSTFAWFCLGTALAGLYGSYVQSYRFAVTEGVDAQRRARAISWIMTAGLLAAIIGTQTVIWTRDTLPSAPFASSFVSQAALALLALTILTRLRPVPMPADTPQGGRPLAQIARAPRFIVAVIAGMVSFGLMSLVMTAAPIAMVGCGHTVGEATLGIQWHVLAMYLPSFFTGRLIERFGKTRITALGLVLTACASSVALSGLGIGHFWGMLILLGVGWNFGFIGATTLLTDCYRPEERTRAQALNDFLVFGSVAMASFSSGRLLSVNGWDTINQLVYPIVALVLALLLWQRRAPLVA